MNIIGESEDGFVLQASKDEVARVSGFGCWVEMEQNGNRARVGSVLAVSDIFDRLHRIGRLRENFASTAAALRMYAQTMEQATSILPQKVPVEIKVPKYCGGGERVAVFDRTLTADEIQVLADSERVYVFNAIVKLMGGTVKS